MRVRILKDKQCIKRIDTDKQSFEAIREIGLMQCKEDILGLGALGRAELGIKSITTKDGVASATEGTLGNVVLDGTDMGFPIDVQMYEAGWVLKTGKVGSNILGGRFESYLKKFTSRQIKMSSKDGAKVFPTTRALISYVKRNRENFEFLVREKGFYWSVETANSLFAEDLFKEYEQLSLKEQGKRKALAQEFASLIEEINDAEPEEEIFEGPEEVTPEMMKEEALFRMKKLSMWENVVKDFEKDGKVYQSEAGGIIYDLNDKARIAVEKVKREGYLPYAVVVTNTTFGELYSVLYVSTHGEEWYCERPDKDGVAMNYTYNATDTILSEYGDAAFEGVNGGLIRVA